MNKIKALYANEIIKIFHRPSVIIVATFTLCMSVLFPILLLIVEGPFNYSIEVEDEREYYENQLNENKRDIANADIKTVKDTVTIEVNGQEKAIPMTLYTGNDVPNLLSNKIVYEDLLANYDFVKQPTRKTWLAYMALARYSRFQLKLINLEMTPFEERDAEWLKEYETMGTARDYARKALFEHDYNVYIEAIKYLDDNDFGRDQTPESIRKIANTDPNGELTVDEGFFLIYYMSEMANDQKMLDSGLESSGNLPRILTEERKEVLRNSIKILEYKLEKHNMFDSKSTLAIQITYLSVTIARYALLVLLILIAGSSISQEMATGSIKSLIIAPVKRWKIFTAKLLSIITFMLAGSILITLLSTLGTGIVCGFDKFPPYLYVSGGVVKEMPFIPAKLILDLIQNIPTFFYAFVALMLSCFTKNTGVSVGTAIGLSLFHEVPTMFQSSDLPQRILDFTPIAGMDFAEKLFPYFRLMVADEDFGMITLSSSPFDNPLWFNTIYTIVLTFTVLLIAFEQFRKKDIA